MLDTGKVSAGSAEKIGVELDANRFSTTRNLGEYGAPWNNDHGMAVSFPAVKVEATLGGGNDIGKILNSPGSHQCFPVGSPGYSGK